MVALNPKSTPVSHSPATPTFLTRKPTQTTNSIYLPSHHRSGSEADKAKQLGYRICRGEMLRWPQDDECSSFVQSSPSSFWNHLLTWHAGSCSWLKTGHLRKMPITTSQPRHRSSEDNNNKEKNSLQKAFNIILVFPPSYNEHPSVCTYSVSISEVMQLFRCCDCPWSFWRQNVPDFNNNPRSCLKKSHLFCISSSENIGLCREACGAHDDCEQAVQESLRVNITGRCHRRFFFLLAGYRAAVFVKHVWSCHMSAGAHTAQAHPSSASVSDDEWLEAGLDL